eukprot:CAMPEP_0171239218 /NCGR_PEP_ID=MMETSP0790-20130122/43866_1 /TAXON_ID=2925 /ORGANISM="Alexandrium catenella, Strain OF101" /LENGTH=579 /DNA_ID=CAMNT_0011705589 /DNA_START=25 /DNA_END=1764 /DNA_ORIENTATION=-
MGEADATGEEGTAPKEPKTKRRRYCGWFCCSGAVLVLALSAARFQAQIAGSLEAFGGVNARTLLWLRCLQDIRTSQVVSEDWYGGAFPRAGQYWMIRMGGLKAALGMNYAHRLLRPNMFSFLVDPWDKESNMCWRLMDYMWVSPLTSGFSYPSLYGGREEIEEWIKACKTVYPELGKQEKMLLDPFWYTGDIPLEALIPPVDDNAGLKTAARSGEPPVWEETEKYTDEEMKQVLRDSISLSTYGEFTQDIPEGMLEYYRMMNIRKPHIIPGTWGAIGKATRAGMITKFDARNLLPKELFNVSYKTMVEWEGDHAKRIPVFADGPVPGSFAHYAKLKEQYDTPAKKKSSVTIADEGRVTVNGRRNSFDPSVIQQVSVQDSEYTRAGYVHTRRLPEFHKKLPNVEKEMGIEGDVLRGQSMLWLGATPGGFHYDEEANVYVQLSGHSFAFLVPQNWTEYFTGAIRHPWGSGGLPGISELEKDPKLRDVPVFLIPIGPGEGITLQSRTYHRFMAQTFDRIALNWFFIPRWRKMEYTPADWYSIEANRSLHRLALRQLWARTLTRVYEDTGRGIIYMGTKLEYI